MSRAFHVITPLAVAGVFALVVVVGNNDAYVQENSVARVGGLGGVSVLDEVSAADVAARIAVGAELLVADNVQNLADSQKAQVEFAATDDSYLVKPQLVATDAKTSKDIVKYTVQPGDTVPSIAKKFNITSNTVRWENNIIGDQVTVGKVLTILPVSGVRYTVRNNDTGEAIAERFGANAAQIIAFNDAELTGLRAGMNIIIPDGEQPVQSRSYFSSGYGYAFGTQPLYGGNGYSYGYCTWHVANRRAAIGNPIPRNLGNAVTWYSLSQSAGIPTGNTPKQGAVLWHRATYIAGGLGHVGFVEEVYPDGSILVSDMNYPVWNGVTTRVIQPSEFDQYRFIY